MSDAAHFDPGIPGRGMAKTGPGRLAQFQSGVRRRLDHARARAGRRRGRRAAIRRRDPLGGAGRRRRGASATSGRPTSSASSRRSSARRRAAHIPAPRRPWLDELASVYDLGLLRQRTDAELLHRRVSDVPGPPAAASGLLPARRRRQHRDLRHRRLGQVDRAAHARVGRRDHPARRPGARLRSRLRRGQPADARERCRTSDPSSRATTPSASSACSGCSRTELDDRGPRFAEANASSITEYRRLTGRPDEPRILLLVDGFPNFREDFEIPAGRSQWYDVFQRPAHRRPAARHPRRAHRRPRRRRAHRRSARWCSAGSCCGSRTTATGCSTCRATSSGPSSPPGRAIVDGYETQIAVLGGSASVADQSAATTPAGRGDGARGVPARPGDRLAAEGARARGASRRRTTGAPVLGVERPRPRAVRLRAVGHAARRRPARERPHHHARGVWRRPSRASTPRRASTTWATRARRSAPRCALDRPGDARPRTPPRWPATWPPRSPTRHGGADRGVRREHRRLPADPGRLPHRRAGARRPPQRPPAGGRGGDERVGIVVAAARRGQERPPRAAAAAGLGRGRPAAEDAAAPAEPVGVPAGTRGVHPKGSFARVQVPLVDASLPARVRGLETITEGGSSRNLLRCGSAAGDPYGWRANVRRRMTRDGLERAGGAHSSSSLSQGQRGRPRWRKRPTSTSW